MNCSKKSVEVSVESGENVDDVFSAIEKPELVIPDLASLSTLTSSLSTKSKDIFAEEKRKAWDKSVEARCDFTYRLRLTRRSNVNFVSI